MTKKRKFEISLYDLHYVSFAEGFLFRELSERGKLDHPALWGLSKLGQKMIDELSQPTPKGGGKS